MSSTFTIPSDTADGAALTVTDSAALAASTIVGTLDAGSSGLAGVDVIRISAGAFTLGVRTVVAGGVTGAPATFTYSVHDDDFDASDVLRIHDLAASGAVSSGPSGAPGMTQRGAHDPLATYAPGDVVTDAGGLYVNTVAVVPDTRTDTFARPDQDGWGTASDGHTWAALGAHGGAALSTEALVAGAGVQSGAPDDSDNQNIVLLSPALDSANCEVLLSWALSDNPNSSELIVFVRYSDSTHRVLFSPYLNGQTTLTLQAGEASDSHAGTWAGGTVGNTYWTRLRAVGQTYSWRTWADGDPEPPAWDDTFTATPSVGAGRVGIWSDLGTGDTLTIDSFNATTSFLVPADNPAHWAPLADMRGVPRLYGPYTIEYTDIPINEAAKTLWAPAAGDVLLRLFADQGNLTQWDTGYLDIVQAQSGTPLARFATANAGDIALGANGSLDNVYAGSQGMTRGAGNSSVYTTAYVFHTSDPVQIRWIADGNDPASTGHVELYALVARAVAPVVAP